MKERNYGRRYDAQFKEQAVKLLLSSGKSLHCVAQELGISDNALKDWKDVHLQQGGSAAEFEIENQRLRRELERVTQQRDILKNPSAYFRRIHCRKVCPNESPGSGVFPGAAVRSL